jgi:hypothetical protein
MQTLTEKIYHQPLDKQISAPAVTQGHALQLWSHLLLLLAQTSPVNI